MRSGVYTNVVFELLERAKENLRAVADVGGNHKVADLLVLRFDEVLELLTRAGSSKRAPSMPKPVMPSGIRPCSALIGAGAHFRSTGILIAAGCAVIRWGWRGRNDIFGGHQAIAEGMNAEGSDAGHLVVHSVQ